MLTEISQALKDCIHDLTDVGNSETVRSGENGDRRIVRKEHRWPSLPCLCSQTDCDCSLPLASEVYQESFT